MIRCLVLAAVLLAALPQAAQAQAVKFRTVVKGDGLSSSIPRQSVTIRGERRWTKLWDTLDESGDAPEIDFSRHMLIAVTQGRRPSGGHAIRIRRIVRAGGAWVVSVVETEPSRGCPSTGVITSPYHVVRVPRSARRISFERTVTERDCR
jgi:hypothetical protein